MLLQEAQALCGAIWRVSVGAAALEQCSISSLRDELKKAGIHSCMDGELTSDMGNKFCSHLEGWLGPPMQEQDDARGFWDITLGGAGTQQPK